MKVRIPEVARETTVYLIGMHGFGDNYHQRGPLRYLLRNYKEVWLESSSVEMYTDLIEEYGLKVINKESPLRTQKKNATREKGMFYCGDPLAEIKGPRLDRSIWYRAKDVKHLGSVMASMCQSLDLPLEECWDFRLPVRSEWVARLERNHPEIIAAERLKPILVYRPLVDRPSDWSGCNARNPLKEVYADLFDSIRNDFTTVSIADIEPGKEWIVDARPMQCDFELHKGELTIGEQAALFSRAALVYCSPGFAVPLSQAVSTPVACVFGGYENSKSFSVGARWTPYLGIDPINSCQCFLHSHACDKRIDIPLAKSRLQRFAQDVYHARIGGSRTGDAKQEPCEYFAASA